MADDRPLRTLHKDSLIAMIYFLEAEVDFYRGALEEVGIHHEQDCPTRYNHALRTPRACKCNASIVSNALARPWNGITK